MIYPARNSQLWNTFLLYKLKHMPSRIGSETSVIGLVYDKLLDLFLLLWYTIIKQ